MRKDFGAKPFTYPQPVLILGSYDKDGNPDAMNAAWGGISGGNEISMWPALIHVHKRGPQVHEEYSREKGIHREHG